MRKRILKIVSTIIFCFLLMNTADAALIPLGTDLKDVEGIVQWYKADAERNDVGYYIVPNEPKISFFNIPIKQVTYTFIDDKLRIILMYYDYGKYSQQLESSLVLETGKDFTQISNFPAHVWRMGPYYISNEISKNNSSDTMTIGVISICRFDY